MLKVGSNASIFLGVFWFWLPIFTSCPILGNPLPMLGLT